MLATTSGKVTVALLVFTLILAVALHHHHFTNPLISLAARLARMTR